MSERGQLVTIHGEEWYTDEPLADPERIAARMDVFAAHLRARTRPMTTDEVREFSVELKRFATRLSLWSRRVDNRDDGPCQSCGRVGCRRVHVGAVFARSDGGWSGQWLIDKRVRTGWRVTSGQARRYVRHIGPPLWRFVRFDFHETEVSK